MASYESHLSARALDAHLVLASLVQDTETAVLAKAYQLCMSGNANLLMNLAPDNTGRIPSEAVDTTHLVAERIRP